MIKKALQQLNEEEHRQLMHAFEQGFGQYIELPDDRFIGVNIRSIAHLHVLESAGDWAYGVIRKSKDVA